MIIIGAKRNPVIEAEWWVNGGFIILFCILCVFFKFSIIKYYKRKKMLKITHIANEGQRTWRKVIQVQMPTSSHPYYCTQMSLLCIYLISKFMSQKEMPQQIILISLEFLWRKPQYKVWNIASRETSISRKIPRYTTVTHKHFQNLHFVRCTYRENQQRMSQPREPKVP